MKLLFTQDALVNAGAERSHLEILSRFSGETEAGRMYFLPRFGIGSLRSVASFGFNPKNPGLMDLNLSDNLKITFDRN